MEEQQPLTPLPQQPQEQPANTMAESNGFQAMIPTKNVPSLVSYYTGIFSFIPFIGFILGILGIVFGIKALNIVKLNPTPGAKVHAIIGLVFSLLFLAVHVGFTVMILISATF
jgi:hypothetical protein